MLLTTTGCYGYCYGSVITIAMVKVHIHIENPLILLPQFEDSKNSVIHITEPRCLIPYITTHIQSDAPVTR